jgi:heme/copper-type cytochrome/quinol oxidase subunit 2
MHVQAPDRETEVHDQEEFDDTVAKSGRLVLQGLVGAGIVAALLMSIVSLNQSSERSTVTVTSGVVTPAAAGSTAAAVSKTPAKVISLQVIGGSKSNAKVGPDGKKHDTFTKTEFAVKVGQPLQLKIDNTDDVEHSITSPQVGVNIVVKPGVHVYQLVVKEAGRFSWFCIIPCDSDANGWAMQHAGFMSGFITAT